MFERVLPWTPAIVILLVAAMVVLFHEPYPGLDDASLQRRVLGCYYSGQMKLMRIAPSAIFDKRGNETPYRVNFGNTGIVISPRNEIELNAFGEVSISPKPTSLNLIYFDIRIRVLNYQSQELVLEKRSC